MEIDQEKQELIDEIQQPQISSVEFKKYPDEKVLQEQPQVVFTAVAPVGPRPPRPKSYLAHAICVILCCFWPVGFIALYKEYQARRFYDDGLYDDANAASKEARLASVVGFAIGCISHAIGWGITLFIWTAIGITFGVLAATGAFDNVTNSTVS